MPYQRFPLTEVVLPDFSDVSDINRKIMLNGKTIQILTITRDLLSNMGKLRVIHPSKLLMNQLRQYRQEGCFVVALFDLDLLIHKLKFATFGYKSVIFNFKKLWGWIDFVAVHTNDSRWVSHRFTSLIPSITYQHQETLYFSHRPDFLYIYQVPEYMACQQRKDHKHLVAKICGPFWVKPDILNNKIEVLQDNLTNAQEQSFKKALSSIKNLDIDSNAHPLFRLLTPPKRLNHFCLLPSSNKSLLFNGLATEHRAQRKNQLIDYVISEAWYHNHSLLQSLMTFLNTLVIRHLYLLALYVTYEIELGIPIILPDYARLIKAGLLNKDIEASLIDSDSQQSAKLNKHIWLGETFHGLELEEADMLCELLERGHFSPKIDDHGRSKQSSGADNKITPLPEDLFSQDPKYRVLNYLRAYLCSEKHESVPYGYLGTNPLAYYNLMENVQAGTTKESFFAEIRNKLYVVCYLPGFVSSVFADEHFLQWYQKKEKAKKLHSCSTYIRKFYHKHQKYLKNFIDHAVTDLLLHSCSTMKGSYIPVVFRYGAFASTTALTRANANMSNRLEFEIYDTPERLHNQLSAQEQSVMPSDSRKAKAHSIDNGMSLFSLNLTNQQENGLRHKVLELSQQANLDIKVGISGNLDQAMTQALLLGMGTKKLGNKLQPDHDQLYYVTLLYCIFMGHSVDHTIDEILLSTNTYLDQTQVQNLYPVKSIDQFFGASVYGLNKDKTYQRLAEAYQKTLQPKAADLHDQFISKVQGISEVYDDIANFNSLYSSLGESSLYGLLVLHDTSQAVLPEQYSVKKKAEITAKDYREYGVINQYQQMQKMGRMVSAHGKFDKKAAQQAKTNYETYLSDQDKIAYLKYNFKDQRVDAVYKDKPKQPSSSPYLFAKKQNVRFVYRYIHKFFVNNRVTVFYKIQNNSGKYLVDLHDEKYSFATPNSDSKVYRMSPELLNDKKQFLAVSKDITQSYRYLTLAQQKENLLRDFDKQQLASANQELWVGLSKESMSCFAALDDLSTQENANAFIDELYYLQVIKLYYHRDVPLLLVNAAQLKSKLPGKTAHYYLPTYGAMEKLITLVLKKAKKELIHRLCIILNIYNTSTKEMAKLILIRLSLLLCTKENQQKKLMAIQKLAHEYRLKNIQQKLSTAAWIQSVFYVQHTHLAQQDEKKALLLKLLQELYVHNKISQTKKAMLKKILQQDYNYYQLLMEIIKTSLWHRIKLFNGVTTTTEVLATILQKPHYQSIKTMIDGLAVRVEDKNLSLHHQLKLMKVNYDLLGKASFYGQDFFTA